MPVSARILGESYGLNAQEMNLALVKNGILDGEPGAYQLTEKGKRFAHEKDYHRGPGGYSCFNRDWTTVSYDKAIKNELRITPAMKAEIREELAARRAAKRAQREAASAAAEEAYWASLMKEKETPECDSTNHSKFMGDVAKYGVVILCAAVVGYGLFKLGPMIKKWWKKKKNERRKRKTPDVEPE